MLLKILEDPSVPEVTRGLQDTGLSSSHQQCMRPTTDRIDPACVRDIVTECSQSTPVCTKARHDTYCIGLNSIWTCVIVGTNPRATDHCWHTELS